MLMKPPALVLTNRIDGEPTAWKCPAYSEPFDLSRYKGTSEEKVAQMKAAYSKHFNDRHSHEYASQASARIVREVTEK
jgi:hypothetical protein